MRLQVVSVLDRATAAYGRPVFVQAIGQAMRSFTDEANNKESDIGKHPDDYDLYHLGDWDDVSGRFSNFEEPKHLVRAKDLVTREV